jgi:hypothetical protein
LLKEILPEVKSRDDLSFKTLVSWNMLGVISRELKQEEENLKEEFLSLVRILGGSDPRNQSLEISMDSFLSKNQSEKKEILEALNKLFVEKIRKEKILPSNSEYLSHIESVLIAKLAISNPRFGT